MLGTVVGNITADLSYSTKPVIPPSEHSPSRPPDSDVRDGFQVPWPRIVEEATRGLQ